MSYIPAAVIKDGGATTENIRADRSANQSPIDNTKDGIVNLSSDTGAGIGCRANYAAILGGDLNEIQDANGLYCVIAGGSENQICLTGTDYSWCSIGGGWQNLIGSTTQGAFNTIAGGALNKIGQTAVDSIQSTIGGGRENKIEGENATIAGGNTNTIYADATVESAGFIGGGAGNSIGIGAGASLVFNAIAGGLDNKIGNGAASPAAYGSIGGGQANEISYAAAVTCHWGTIGGGQANIIGINLSANHGAICGGFNNACDGSKSFIGGGDSNGTQGPYSVVAGGAGNNAALTALYSAIGGGSANRTTTAGGTGTGTGVPYYTSIPGGSNGVAFRTSQQVHPGGAWSDVLSEAGGNRQWSRYFVFGIDVNAAGTILLDDTANQFSTEDAHSYKIKVSCLAIRTDAPGRACFEDNILAHCTAGVVTIDAQAQDTNATFLNGETWTIVYGVDGANNITATFTGTAGHTIKALVSYEFIESTEAST